MQPLAKKSVNFAKDTKPAAKPSDYASLPVFRQQQQQPPQHLPAKDEVKAAPVKVSATTMAPAMERPITTTNHIYHHQPIYVKKEDRTVASIMGGDDDDDEIGLDELDDDYLNAADSPSPPPSDFQRHNSMTRKQANSFVLQRSMQSQKSPVSLTQLPPPLENCIVESDLEVLGMKQTHYHVHSHIAHSHAVAHAAGGGHYTNRQHNNPIQIQFHAAGGGLIIGGPQRAAGGGGGGGTAAISPTTENLVLAPPPQFSDGVESPAANKGVHHGHHMHYHGQQPQQKLGPNVRIVGAVPKSTNRF